MGVLRRAIGLGFPMTRLGAGLWAWRHRHEMLGWAGFAAGAGPRLLGDDRADVLVEARLRARLTADSRTRNVDGLRVSVTDGVATLAGMVPTRAHDAALAIATNTAGVTRVRDELIEPKSRRRSIT